MARQQRSPMGTAITGGGSGRPIFYPKDKKGRQRERQGPAKTGRDKVRLLLQANRAERHRNAINLLAQLAAAGRKVAAETVSQVKGLRWLRPDGA
jgi:hypothetical protein